MKGRDTSLAIVMTGSALGIISSGAGLVTMAAGARPDTWAVALGYCNVAGFAAAALILARALRRHQ